MKGNRKKIKWKYSYPWVTVAQATCSLRSWPSTWRANGGSGLPNDLRNAYSQTWFHTGPRRQEGLLMEVNWLSFPFLQYNCGICTELKLKNIKKYLWSCNFCLSGNKFCQQITTRQNHTHVHCNKAYEVLTRLQSLEPLVENCHTIANHISSVLEMEIKMQDLLYTTERQFFIWMKFYLHTFLFHILIIYKSKSHF